MTLQRIQGQLEHPINHIIAAKVMTRVGAIYAGWEQLVFSCINGIRNDIEEAGGAFIWSVTLLMIMGAEWPRGLSLNPGGAEPESSWSSASSSSRGRWRRGRWPW